MEGVMKNKTLLFFAALLFCTAVSFIGLDNDGEAASSQAAPGLTKKDFAGDPSLFAVPGETVVVTFLEPPDIRLNGQEEAILAQEDATDPCTNGTLAPGGGEDLVVTGPCTVGAGIYRYGNVNIIEGGTLEFKESKDAEIHFWAKSILVENNGSLIAGTTAPIGTNNGALTIHLYGSDSDKNGIECKSPLVNGVPCGIPKGVWDSNQPLTPTCNKTDLSGVSDCFYQYMPADNVPGETGFFGRKVLAVSYGGTLKLFGKKGATYKEGVQNWDSGMSWVRLDDRDLKPDKDILTLDRPVDWEEGDRVVVTTTDYLPGHSEELEIIKKLGPEMIRVRRIDPITNMPPPNCPKDRPGDPKDCGSEYLHNGDLYNLNNLPQRLKQDIKIVNGGEDNGKKYAETRAAVALLTRSIRIVSGGNTFDESKKTCSYDCFPLSEGFFGGHTMIRQGFKEYKVQGVEFYQLGQGGRKARYPVHLHLARKTPNNTFVKDCSVHDSMTRWYTIHGTQGVTLARNVGYLSIGHGYYLEDGTETDNNFYSNIGIFARAAINNDQNPRKVPGILAWGGSKTNADVPYNSDFANPTVFWIMNGWNDFEYNMAAGANACGVCYWLLPGFISTHSRNMVWESYASIQKIIPGGAPLKTFLGNYCSSAQLSFNTVQATDACNGLGELGPVDNPLAPPPNEDYYPKVGGLRQPTLCTGTCSNNKGQPCETNDQCGIGNTCTQDCSQAPPCAVPNPGAPFDNRDFCPVTVLDRYTSSFHWPEKNFAAIWLRGKWMLLSNSVLSDSQNGGLGFVTGGDYTLSSVIPGNWQAAIKSVFIGNTQKDNPLASNAGPFNPLKSRDGKIMGLTCDNTSNRQLYCLSKKEGITMPVSNFSMQQRFYNIYDGPNYQDSNAYLDITKTSLKPQCQPGNCPSTTSGWMYTAAQGIPIDQKSQECVLPNAAIGWKQPNGFYYPPAFHSTNLYFRDVDIRHLVIEPLWKPGTFESDLDQIEKNYCTFDSTTNNNQTFTGFTAVDRQTVLNDDDGSLTGLLSPAAPTEGETISVNLDPFFNAPVEAPECNSFDIETTSGGKTGGTAKTSPYQYVSTVVYPACVVEGNCSGHCSIDNKPCARDKTCPVIPGQPAQKCLDSKWGESCSNQTCYGVPLSRQLVTSLADVDRTMPMMGMGFSQRSMLTVNGGTYYIDTTVSEGTQKKGSGGPSPITSLNVFEPTGTYYLFFVYANELTKQKYQIYIGKGISDFDTNMSKYIKPVRVDIRGDDLKFQEDGVIWNGLKPKYESTSGILTVGTDFSEFRSNFDQTFGDYCRPKSFCKLVNGTCQSSLGTNDPFHNESQRICETVAGKDIDCPLFQFNGPTGKLPGCVGVKVTLGDSSQFIADDIDHRPDSCCFPKEQPWDVKFNRAEFDTAGSCITTVIPNPQFCDKKCP